MKTEFLSEKKSRKGVIWWIDPDIGLCRQYIKIGSVDKGRHTFTKQGFDVVHYDNLFEAIDQLQIAIESKGSLPDIILTAFRFSKEQDCLPLLQILARLENIKIPVIVVSGFLNNEIEDTLSKFVELEFMFSKPPRPRRLIQTIEKVIEQNQADS